MCHQSNDTLPETHHVMQMMSKRKITVKIWKACGQSAGKTTPPRFGVESPETIRLGDWQEKQWIMNLDPQWIVGFVDGEGCFFVGINSHQSLKMRVQVLPEFTVVQHEQDIQLLHGLKSYFGCGVVGKNHGDRMAYRVRGHNNLLNVILPFFERHKLKSKRRIAFERFRTVVLMMARGDHLTAEGLEKIQAIATTINKHPVSSPILL